MCSLFVDTTLKGKYKFGLTFKNGAFHLWLVPETHFACSFKPIKWILFIIFTPSIPFSVLSLSDR